MSCTIALAAHERKALLDLYRHSPRANASRSDGTARIYVSIQVRFSMYGRHNCLLPKDLKMRLPCPPPAAQQAKQPAVDDEDDTHDPDPAEDQFIMDRYYPRGAPAKRGAARDVGK